jgi:hypothetical protein
VITPAAEAGPAEGAPDPTRRPASHRASGAQQRAAARRESPDADPRHWWLLLPIVASLATPLYNRADPRVFGMPFFYWFQLSLAGLSTIVMTAVYLTTKKQT